MRSPALFRAALNPVSSFGMSEQVAERHQSSRRPKIERPASLARVVARSSRETRVPRMAKLGDLGLISSTKTGVFPRVPSAYALSSSLPSSLAFPLIKT